MEKRAGRLHTRSQVGGDVHEGTRSEVTFTRGHRFKVRGGRFNTDIRRTYFTQRVVGAWNALPGRVWRQICWERLRLIWIAT